MKWEGGGGEKRRERMGGGAKGQIEARVDQAHLSSQYISEPISFIHLKLLCNNVSNINYIKNLNLYRLLGYK